MIYEMEIKGKAVFDVYSGELRQVGEITWNKTFGLPCYCSYRQHETYTFKQLNMITKAMKKFKKMGYEKFWDEN